MNERQAAKQFVMDADDEALHSLIQSAAHTLSPQQREFARWLARYRAPIHEQLKKLKELTGYDWSEDARKTLLGNGLFRTYFLAIKEQGERSIRLRVIEIAAKGMELADWAMDRAKANDDYRAVPNLVSPFLERALPRRQDLVTTSQTIIIQITGAQKAVMEASAPVVDAEIISIEPVDDDHLLNA